MSKAEKFIEEHTRDCSNIMEGYYPNGKQAYYPWIPRRQARKAVEIAREEMVEKAIKWVEYNNENGGCKFDGWVENIKQAMKDDAGKR